MELWKSEVIFCRRVWYHSTLTLISVFVNVSIWWYAVALLLANMGRSSILKQMKPIYRNISISLFVITTGLLFWEHIYPESGFHI